MNLHVIQPAPEPTALDPVCGMTVKLSKPGATLQHEGHDFYFCCQGCATKFQADPVKYLNKDTEAKTEQSSAQPAAGTQVYLPDGPGDRARQAGDLSHLRHGAGADDGDPRPVKSRARQHDAPPLDRPPPSRSRCWPSWSPTCCRPSRCSISSPARARLGGVRPRHSRRPLGRLAVLSARLASSFTRHLNMFTLIAIGSGSAYLYSVAGRRRAPALSRIVSRHVRPDRPLYFEAAAVITVLVLLGQVSGAAEPAAETSGALTALLGLVPKTARRISADGTEARH